jgi:7-cyano-7-deazaguanine reductase
MSNHKFQPRHLGKQSREAVREFDLIPWRGEPLVVNLEATEFTSYCPVTGQPDFGRLAVEYVPGKHLVETKSFKLYLWGWRDRRAFNEDIVNEIASAFFEQVKPAYVRVHGVFNVRGGVGVTATAERGELP